MKTNSINGLQLKKMLQNALAHLQQAEDELNNLNVFPVADGDTGTNMCATLESGLQNTRHTEESCAFLKDLSDGMLLGARGNSGVILSQMFRGFYETLNNDNDIRVEDLSDAFVGAYKSAYASVVHPVEGTILTVAREGIEHIRAQIDHNTTIDQLLSLYLYEMRKSLALTPEKLPALKEAGVVDSGALGYILLVEGMEKYLRGELLDATVSKPAAAQQSIDFSLFDENSTFSDGYCLEFILQLMHHSDYSQSFSLSNYISVLKTLGESIVAVQDGSRVKVHIHTMKPANVLSASQEYGEFLTCKIENMQLQHNEHIQKAVVPQHKPLAIVTVVDSIHAKTIFSELGCDCVINGGRKMNVSVQELTDAFRSVDADSIIVLPNNSNVIQTAQQAASLFHNCPVHILTTHSVPQGYSAIAMDVPDSTDLDYRIRQMKKGMSQAITLSVAIASRDYYVNGMNCSKGSIIGILDGRIVSTGSDPQLVFVEGLHFIEDVDDMETCIVFRGSSESADDEEQLAQKINAAYPMLDVCFIDGGSELYPWAAAIS